MLSAILDEFTGQVTSHFPGDLLLRIMNVRKRAIGVCDHAWSALLVAAGAAVPSPFR